LALTKLWFEQLAPDPMELVMSVCRQPFVELRLASLQVMQVLAEQQWGQERINSTPGKSFFFLFSSVSNGILYQCFIFIGHSIK
jgi:26S proteasome non-ATPase regulatory subunit 5